MYSNVTVITAHKEGSKKRNKPQNIRTLLAELTDKELLGGAYQVQLELGQVLVSLVQCPLSRIGTI